MFLSMIYLTILLFFHTCPVLTSCVIFVASLRSSLGYIPRSEIGSKGCDIFFFFYISLYLFICTASSLQHVGSC